MIIGRVVMLPTVTTSKFHLKYFWDRIINRCIRHVAGHLQTIIMTSFSELLSLQSCYLRYICGKLIKLPTFNVDLNEYLFEGTFSKYASSTFNFLL
jgi:hypothetical protein